ncbi:hypothetical protein J2M53_10200 [Arthrobacter sp. zg-ZUI100]|uniref:hypothetical protein n=1 Tax=Arthrobacter jiangjiafuii TaxID=2817475 RepID=UPI001AEE3012|nr:hypothetical protein [Arthrobacter jiangjiafuii]MBP3036620.1 hypothetical protein [Arthrobacter jiangjiafuii]
MSTHTNPTIEELDALEQGSIAVVLDGPDDKYPEVYTRWATGWKHCTSSKNVPHSALLTHPEQIVKVVSDTADQKGGIPVSSTVEALGALPEGTLVRHINRRAHPVGWVFPGIVRRVQATGFRGVELHSGPVPLEWVAGYDHELTVIWSPQPEADVSAGPDLQQLKEAALAVGSRSWELRKNAWGEPVVMELRGRGEPTEIAWVNNGFGEYTQKLHNFFAAMDPATVLALIARLEDAEAAAGRKCLCVQEQPAGLPEPEGD